MKIAILVSFFPPKWLAGTEIATYNVARQLAKRGHEIHVITSMDEGLSKEGMEQGFYLHRIAYPRVRFLGPISFWLKILLVLKNIKPEIVHAQSIGMGTPGFLSKKFLGQPYVVWGQGSDVYFPNLFRKQISKLTLPNADAVIALTEDMKREIQKVCMREVCIIPNGIHLECLENFSKKKAREKLLIQEDDKVILFVGTLRPIKGLKYLIKAMKIINLKNAGAKLMLVGDGNEKKNLKKLVEELKLEKNVEFIGRVSNEEVPEYMTAADVFVLPSISEGFPVVGLEAFASGLPIVATNVRGLPEIFKNGENGYLIEPKSPEQIAENVLLLLRDDKLRELISTNNREKAKVYSWESVVERLEEVYRNHLKRHG